MVYTVLDIETTGLMKFDANAVLIPDILEVSFLQVDSNTLEIVKNGTLWFYQDHFDIENDAQMIHHITRDFLIQYRDQFEENLMALQALTTNATLITKNGTKFDIPFIKHFLDKYTNGKYDVASITTRLAMKTYDKSSYIYHDSSISNIDVQQLYSPVYRVKKYLQECGEAARFYDKNLTAVEFDDIEAHTDRRKKGKLTEYVDSIPNGREMTQIFYDTLSKDVETKEHGGLYDCVMTYVVWLDYIILKGRLK